MLFFLVRLTFEFFLDASTKNLIKFLIRSSGTGFIKLKVKKAADVPKKTFLDRRKLILVTSRNFPGGEMTAAFE